VSTVFTLEKCSGLTVEEMVDEVREIIDGVQYKADGTKIKSLYWSDERIIKYLNRAYTWANQVLITPCPTICSGSTGSSTRARACPTGSCSPT
jgi:hypothetical protein